MMHSYHLAGLLVAGRSHSIALIVRETVPRGCYGAEYSPATLQAVFRQVQEAKV